jgi:hypothetical protein
MHDPLTVAFEIKYPWPKWGRKGQSEWERSYRENFITIWHKDPLKFAGKCGCRDDDSCGWFRPPCSEDDAKRIRKLAKEQYSSIFERQVRTDESASYARICFTPSAYDAVYWIWLAIKHLYRKRGCWQYGCRLSVRELESIYMLSSNPVDNVRTLVDEVRDEDTFNRLVFCIFRAYQRHYRPWYRHPRWHIAHWRIQFHPW